MGSTAGRDSGQRQRLDASRRTPVRLWPDATRGGQHNEMLKTSNERRSAEASERSPAGVPPAPVFSAGRVSGANMDRTITRHRYARPLRIVFVVLLLATIATGAWWALPRGLAVGVDSSEIATVSRGEFRDEVLLRATVMPLSSVFLDATEAGRVEAVHAYDGQIVKHGDLLFKLSNPQREQEVLARAADIAQQVANVATMRAELASVRSDHRRRVADLEYQLDQKRKTYRRNAQLAEKGFISSVTLEESQDATDQQRRLLDEARADAFSEEATRQRAIAQMDEALKGLNAGLAVIREAVDHLAVRAPIDGRLSDFNLDVGATVKAGDHLGRIDVPDQFKLTAPVDEFYLERVSKGLSGMASIGGRDVPVVLSRVNTQVKDRRFEIEMNFSDRAAPGLQPGQTIDTRLILGKPGTALLLTDGPFFANTAGRWVYVVSHDGKYAKRRNVRLGRRSGGEIEVLEGLAPQERVIVSDYSRFGDAPLLRLQ